MRRFQLAVTGIAVALAAASVALGATAPATKGTYLMRRAHLDAVFNRGTSAKPQLARAIAIVRMGFSTPHGWVAFNGGSAKTQLLEPTIDSFSCEGNTATVSGTGTVNGRSVSYQIDLVDGGTGLANPADTFTINWPRFHYSGAPIAGALYIKCPAAAPTGLTPNPAGPPLP
jgi:hypothetical protein